MSSLPNKKTLIAVNFLSDAFKIALNNELVDVLYIKTTDLKEWTDNQETFVMKEFGDSESGLLLTFIYKDGDKEFEPDNLASDILKFKKVNLYDNK
ncbi:MAG: hypothetical protein WC458_01860 [Patescibacteria group bacterium]